MQRMTDSGYAISPSWAPNGGLLAFSWNRKYGPGDPGGQDIYVMDIASKRWLQATHEAGSNDFPSWSPDGRHIVFQRQIGHRTQIWSMLADGTEAASAHVFRRQLDAQLELEVSVGTAELAAVGGVGRAMSRRRSGRMDYHFIGAEIRRRHAGRQESRAAWDDSLDLFGRSTPLKLRNRILTSALLLVALAAVSGCTRRSSHCRPRRRRPASAGARAHSATDRDADGDFGRRPGAVGLAHDRRHIDLDRRHRRRSLSRA